MSERERFNELVTEAIRSAMDCVQVGDFRDPSARYKEQAAKEDRDALMSAIDALQERVARAEKDAKTLFDILMRVLHDDSGDLDFVIYQIKHALSDAGIDASLSAKEGGERA